MVQPRGNRLGKIVAINSLIPSQFLRSISSVKSSFEWTIPSRVAIQLRESVNSRVQLIDVMSQLITKESEAKKGSVIRCRLYDEYELCYHCSFKCYKSIEKF